MQAMTTSKRKPPSTLWRPVGLIRPGRIPKKGSRSSSIVSNTVVVSKGAAAIVIDSRAMLMASMKEKTKARSAEWLAKELGYRDVKEHLRDLKVPETTTIAIASYTSTAQLTRFLGHYWCGHDPCRLLSLQGRL